MVPKLFSICRSYPKQFKHYNKRIEKGRKNILDIAMKLGLRVQGVNFFCYNSIALGEQIISDFSQITKQKTKENDLSAKITRVMHGDIVEIEGLVYARYTASIVIDF